MKRKLLTLIALASVLSLVVVPACAPGGGGELPPIKIGLVVHRSGLLAGYGQQVERGFMLGLQYATEGSMKVLGRDIVVMIEDDQTNPTLTRTKAEKLLDEGATFLTGPASTPCALVLNALAIERKNFIVVQGASPGLSVTGSQFNRYVFRTAQNNDQDAMAAVAYGIEELGYKWGLFGPEGPAGQDPILAWGDALTAANATIVYNSTAPLDTMDFAPYVAPYLELAGQGNLDVVGITWAGATAGAFFNGFVMPLVEVGVPCYGVLADTAALRALPPEWEGGVAVARYFWNLPDNEVNDWLVQTHNATYQEPPELFTDSSFAAAQAIVEGIKRAGTADNVDQLIAAMEGMTWQTPKGARTFRREDHQALQEAYIVQLVFNEELGILYPQLLETIPAADLVPPIRVP